MQYAQNRRDQISIYAYKVGEGGIVYKIIFRKSENLAKFKAFEIYFSSFYKSIDDQS